MRLAQAGGAWDAHHFLDVHNIKRSIAASWQARIQ
jgi:hypothetical protein